MRLSSVPDGSAGDDVTAALLGVLDQLSGHATDPGSVADAVRIDRIAALERLRSALAAAQHAEMVAFGRGQVEEQIAQVEAGRLDPVALGRGIADQIALACKTSPFHGSRRLGIARALPRQFRTGTVSAAPGVAHRVKVDSPCRIGQLARGVGRRRARAAMAFPRPWRAAAARRWRGTDTRRWSTW
jgi:hypothetical protein